MSRHFSEEVIERYRTGKLSPAELLDLDDHLALCDSCRAEMRNNENLPETYAQAISALQPESAIEDRHLAYQHIADYVDYSLSDVDRELADSHLEFCSRCRTEVKDLEAMKAGLAGLPDINYLPRKTPGVWPRLAAWWQLPSIRIPVQVATAAVLIALIVWVVTLTRHSPRLSQQAQVNPGEPEKNQTVANNSPVAPRQEEQKDVRLAADLIDSDRHITLTSDDKLSGLEAASIQVQNEVVSALKNGRVKAPSFIADLKGTSGRLMGAGSSGYGLMNPVATAVERRTPTFRWHAIEGAEGYVVTIYDLDSKKIETSGPLAETKWKASAPLVRGRIYTWQVRVSKQGEEVLIPPAAAPAAKFRIIEAARAEELMQVRHSKARSHLVLGLTYADAGLLDDAERELQELVAANPKSSVARSLLRSVQAQKATR